MADIESNIKVNIDTSDALAQLKLLQQQISAFQQAMRNAGAANAKAAAAMQQNLVTSINATGKFSANIQTIKSSAESFTEALEKNKMSIGEYFRYAGGASKTFGKLFKSEFQTIQQVAIDRVKTLQTQYIKLGRDANGALKAIAVRPLALDMQNVATKTQIAAQRQQLFNQLMKQGSTQLLNFGKNTQWAGRQLMVGFTIPLTMAGSAAAKAYMEIEKASIKFKRVYGDMNTTTEETNKMVKSIQAMANEFTKYGLAVSETMDMAASAAAMGKTGADLMAQVAQASKLAVLGGVEQQQALDTTISLTNAFKVSTDQLAGSVDFLNAVENQTVLSIEDMTIAIPKAAPVIQQLGGDVKDLAFFLTAMREGGINASEGANALKSGLASMINPTSKASEFLQKFGINVKGIVEANKGDIRGTVIGFAKALDTLDPLNRARAIEQMFGKFQFSRLSTLFQNVISEGSQANNVLSIANATTEELAVLSEREMKKVEDSPMFKFQKSIEQMQAKLAPIGEAFLKAVTPIIDFVSKILDGFNNLSEGSKQFITILVTAVAGIGPILLMTFGLIANGVANIMKLFTNIKGFINKTTKPSDILGEQTKYMTTEQLKGAAIAASLDQAHAKLKQTFTSEAAAVDALTQAYRRAVEAQQAYSGIPGVPVGNPNAVPPKKYAGGVSMVPGPKGAGDIVPALLSPGEAVIPAKSAQKYAPVIRGMIAGNLPGFEDGTPGAGMRQSVIGPLTEKQTEGLARTGKTLKEISDEVYAGPYNNMPITDFGTQITPTTGHSFPAFGVGGIYQKPDGTKVFVKPQIDATSALAEIRGTTIARDAHGLVAPQQKLAVMMDPTDPEGRRKFLVLESALDPRLADVPKTFSKDNYIKQLVASLLRGDKDLGVGNLGENILADVGPAGVFQRASGKRQLGGKINSMEEQAIINLLGVKGGAKRFFAESTAEIAKSMTAAEFDTLIRNEIQTVMPKLAATIAGFGNLSPEEKAAYQAMQERLQAGMSVDWAKYHAMHSVVPPKKYFEGIDEIGGLNEEGKTNKETIEKFARNLSKADYNLYSNYLGLQDTHIVPGLNITDSAIIAQLEQASGTQINQERLRQSGLFALANVTATFPTKLNQRMKTGNPPSGKLFSTIWNSFSGKLRKLVRVSGATSITGDLLEQKIGTESSNLSPASDRAVSELVMEILQGDKKYQQILTQASRVGVVRTSLSRRKEEAEAQGRKIGESQALYEAMVRGELSPNAGASSIDADIRENQNDDVTNPGFARIGRLADGSYKFTTSDISSKIIFNAKQKETIAEIFQERLRMEAKAKLREWFDNSRPTEVPETGLLDSQLPKAHTKIAPREQDYELIKNIFDSEEWKQFEGLSKEQQATTIENLLRQRGQQLSPQFSGKEKTVALRGSATGLGAYDFTDENQNIFRQISYESQNLKSESEFRTNKTGKDAWNLFRTLRDENLFAGPQQGFANPNSSNFFKDVLKLAKGTPEVKPTGKPKASVFDIDDTLVHAAALIESNRAKNEKLPKEQRTKWYEELAKNPQGVTAAIERLKAAQARGNKILLMTARPEAYRASTLEMLQKLGIDMKGIQLITRRDKDYRKPDQMKLDKTSKYMQWYDIEEFYDDLPETRDAISTLGIKVFDPLKLAKGGIIPGYAKGEDSVVKKASLEDLNLFEMNKDKLGATPGGFRKIDGTKYYIKNTKSGTDASVELIMSELNQAMQNPGAHKMTMFGKGLIGSKFVPGLKNTMYSTMTEWLESQRNKQLAAETLISASKDFITKDIAFNAMIGNTDTHTNNVVFNPKTGKFVNLDLGVNSAQGNSQSQKFNTSAQSGIQNFKANVMSAIKTVISPKQAEALSKKYGIDLNPYATKTNNTYDTSPEILKMAELLGFDLSKPITANPINLKTNPFVLSLIAKNPELMDILELNKTSSGMKSEAALSQIFKTLKAGIKKPILKFANGVFSVPGPKGAGDVVPAMLSPGEAVIPAKQAEKHRPLITQMIAGNLPGYAKGTPGIGSKIISGAKTLIAKLILPAGFADGMNVEVDAGSTTKTKSKVVDDQTRVQDKAEKLLKREQEEAKQKTKLAQMSDEELDKYIQIGEGKSEQAYQHHRVLLEEMRNIELNEQKLSEQEKQAALAQKQIELNRSREAIRDKDAEKGWFKRTKMTGAITGGLYAMSGALSALSAVPGDVGKAAQAALPSIGAMTTAMSIIPGKAGLVVGALAAVGTIFVQINDHLTKLREESAALTRALGSGSGALQKYAEFAKTVSASESMDKRRETSAGNFFNIVPGKKTFGETYMETEAGKQLVKDVSAGIASGGMDKAKLLITQQLTAAITAGVLNPAQARSIANNLGAQLGDSQFGIEIAGKLTDILGPKGENLKNEPLKIALQVTEMSMEQVRQNTKAVAESGSAKRVGGSGSVGNSLSAGFGLGVTGLATGTAAAAVASSISVSASAIGASVPAIIAGTAALGTAVPVIGTIVGAVAGLGIGLVQYQAELSKSIAAQNESMITALQTMKQMEDSLQVNYEKRIANARAAGDEAEAIRLQNQYLIDQKELLEANKQNVQELFEIGKNRSSDWGLFGMGEQTTASNAANDAIKKAFEGSGQEAQAAVIQSRIDNMGGEDYQRTAIKQMVAAKTLDLTQAQTAIDVFGGDQKTMDQLQTLLENNPTQANRALGLAGNLGTKEEQKKFLLDISTKDPQKAQQTLDALELAQKTTGVFYGDKKVVEAVMKFSMANEDKMIEFNNNIENLKKQKTIDISVVSKFLGKDIAAYLQQPGISKYFKGYNNKSKAVFLTEFQQIMAMKGDKTMMNAYEAYLSENGNKNKTFADFAAYQSDRTVTAQGTEALGPDGGGDGTGSGPDASILDPYVKMLREGSNWQQKLTVGWNASYKAIMNYGSAAINKMAGVASLMKQYGADSGIINAFLGGTPEEQDKIIDKSTGKLRAGAGILLAKMKQIQDMQQYGLSYVLASTSERLQKHNELYQAGLDVIAGKEKKVNDKYDKRIKALDEIGKIQQRNNQQQQDTLTLADALSKGDIAAAARAAMTAKQNQEKQALEDAKANLELARKKELSEITVIIGDETLNRDKLEERIANNSQRIAEYKLKELNRQMGIALAAKEAAKHSAEQLKNGKALAGLPGANGGGTSGTSGSKDTGTPPGKDTGKDTGKKFSLTKFQAAQAGATKEGLEAAKQAATTAVETSKSAILKKFKGINATELNTALATGDYQSIYKKLKPEDRDKFVSMFQDVKSKQTDLEKYNPTYGTDITTSVAAQEAKAAIVEAIPQAVRDAANTLKENSSTGQLGAWQQDVKDFDNARRAYLDKRDKLGLKNVSWADMTPENKTKLQAEYDAFMVQDKKVRGKLQATNDAREILQDFFSKAKISGEKEKTAFLNEHFAGYSYKFEDSQLRTVDGSKDFMGWKHYASGGMVAPKGYARGGGIYGTDTVPAMLTPGEFIMRKSAVERIGVNNLNKMNSGTSSGDSVYNYSITLNVSSNSDSNEIADAVLRQIKRIDSQRIRSSNI